MNKIKFLSLIAVFASLLTACEKYEEMNENPNEPTVVSPDVLLANAIRNSVNTTTTESFLLGNNAAQLTAKTLRTEIDAYNWNAFPTVWDGLYTSLTDLKSAEQLAVEDGNEKMQGVVLVMRSWIYSVLTKAYGDIPYSEAIQGDEDNFTPAYDNQQDIWNSLLDELQRAEGLLAGNGNITGDLIYDGDANRWIQFSRSLQLRLLLNAHGKYPDVATRFNAIVTGGNLMASNADGAVLDYLAGFPNQFPLIPLKTGDFDAVAISQNLLTAFRENNDPRLMRYARPDNDDYTDTSSFSGAVNGSNNANCSKNGSRLGVQYYNYPDFVQASTLGLEAANGILMSYGELCFIRAEAAARGWTTEDAATLYQNGIEASMSYHNVDYGLFGWNGFNDFYTNSGVAYSAIQDIWEQKWIALFFHGLEPYFEVRRWYVESGNSFDPISFLTLPCDDLNGGELPMRFLYPGEEISLNSSNYSDAQSNLSDENSRMWLVTP